MLGYRACGEETEKIKMIENVLDRRNVSLKTKIGIKSGVAVFVTALAVVLPQIAHLIFGESAGVTLLPMYLPVLLGGCLLGSYWGIWVGMLAPLFSYIITGAFGSAMPAAARLPFMMAELTVFAVVSGLFSKAIAKNKFLAFPAVITAEVLGRGSFLALVAVFSSKTPFTVPMILGQIKTGLTGLAAQAVIVPLIVILLSERMNAEK